MAKRKRRSAPPSAPHGPLAFFHGTYDSLLEFIDENQRTERVWVRGESLPLQHLVDLGWPNVLIAAFQGGVAKVSLHRPRRSDGKPSKKAFWHTYMPLGFYRDLAQTYEGLSLDGLRMNRYLP